MPSGHEEDFTLKPKEHFTPRPGKPYVWATWLSRYLAGSDQCLWRLWFKAHFKYDKLSDPTFDSAKYTTEHDACVLQRKKKLESQGYTVRLERENEIKWEGQTALMGGRIDIVATMERQPPLLPIILIDDVKTGGQHDRDYWQVLIYMLAWSKRLEAEAKARGLPYAGPYDMRGEVVYRDRIVPLSADEELIPSNEKKVTSLLKLAGAKTGPAKAPSRGECKFCDIPKTCCPDRVEEKDDKSRVVSDDF